jgi:parallel beta-helix repeat protein
MPDPTLPKPGHVLEVIQGDPTAKYQTIQSAVNAAVAGDEILVFPGTYKESVTVNKDNIDIQGVGQVIIANPGSASTGVLVQGVSNAPITGFKLANVTVSGFTGDGVSLVGVSNFILANVTAKDNGEYGLSAALSSGGVIGGSRATGSNDSGIYVGQSHDVWVHGDRTFGNVNGIEIENSSNVTVGGNLVHGNTVGILVDKLPGAAVAVPGAAPVLTSTNNVIRNNLVFDNNRPNTAPSGSLAAAETPGAGIVLVGGDHTLVGGNIVLRNAYAGIAVLSGADLLRLAPSTPAYSSGVDPNPSSILVQHNAVLLNGFVAAPSGYPASADLVWTGSGSNNHWYQNAHRTSSPATLP